MEWLKQLIRAAVRDEIKAALDKQTEGIVAVLNAYTARMANLEAAVNCQTESMNLIAESLYGLTEIVVAMNNALRGERDEADWWKGERA